MRIVARSEHGLILDADPERVRANATFMADKLRALIDPHKAPFEEGPFRNTTTNGETSLAKMLALAIVMAELVEEHATLGHEPGEDADDDAYDELDAEDVEKLLTRIERDIERRAKGEPPRWTTVALTSTLTALREEINLGGGEVKDRAFARIQTALDRLTPTSKAA